MTEFNPLVVTPKPKQLLEQARDDLRDFAAAKGEGGIDALKAAATHLRQALEAARKGAAVHRASLGDPAQAYIRDQVPSYEEVARFSKPALAAWWDLYDTSVELELAFRKEVAITTGATGVSGHAMPLRFTDKRNPEAMALCDKLEAERRKAARQTAKRFTRGRDYVPLRSRLEQLGGFERRAGKSLKPSL